jgi:hypothetical protein
MKRLLTCKFTKKLEWPKDLKATTTVSRAEGTIGLFTTFRPSRAIHIHSHFTNSLSSITGSGRVIHMMQSVSRAAKNNTIYRL